MKHLLSALPVALLLALVGCTASQLAPVATAVVDDLACAQDEAKIQGQPVAKALLLATDPNCQAALQASGAAVTAVVAVVHGAPPAPVKP